MSSKLFSKLSPKNSLPGILQRSLLNSGSDTMFQTNYKTLMGFFGYSDLNSSYKNVRPVFMDSSTTNKRKHCTVVHVHSEEAIEGTSEVFWPNSGLGRLKNPDKVKQFLAGYNLNDQIKTNNNKHLNYNNNKNLNYTDALNTDLNNVAKQCLKFLLPAVKESVFHVGWEGKFEWAAVTSEKLEPISSVKKDWETAVGVPVLYKTGFLSAGVKGGKLKIGSVERKKKMCPVTFAEAIEEVLQFGNDAMRIVLICGMLGMWIKDIKVGFLDLFLGFFGFVFYPHEGLRVVFKIVFRVFRGRGLFFGG